METTQKKAASFKDIRSAGWVIVICFIIAVLIFHFVLGNPSNFMNNDPNNHPLPGNFLGTIYKGGFIVPVIQTLLLTVIALSIERYIAIGAAFGKGSLVKFVANIKAALAEGDMKKASSVSKLRLPPPCSGTAHHAAKHTIPAITAAATLPHLR